MCVDNNKCIAFHNVGALPGSKEAYAFPPIPGVLYYAWVNAPCMLYLYCFGR